MEDAEKALINYQNNQGRGFILNVEGNPCSQKRHRHAKRGRRIITYDPSSEDKKAFKAKVLEQIKGKPLKKPLALSVCFFIKRPKKHYRTGKFSHILKKYSPMLCIQKPDIDNLIKFVLDACNDVLWEDDKLVYEIQSRKVYSENPRTEIEVWEYVS